VEVAEDGFALTGFGGDDGEDVDHSRSIPEVPRASQRRAFRRERRVYTDTPADQDREPPA
jgi:hypothetical protein